MPKATVYMICDEAEFIERARTYFAPQGVRVVPYTAVQWYEGLERPQFRIQLAEAGTPTLAFGAGGSNLLPFTSSPSMEMKNMEIRLPAHEKIMDLTFVGPTLGEERIVPMEELENKAIEMAIQKCRGNLTEAARALGIGRATLYRKVKQLNIDPSLSRRRRVVAA